MLAKKDDEVKPLFRGLKFIPTLPVTSSNESLLKDFYNLAKTMHLKYMFADGCTETFCALFYNTRSKLEHV